MTFKEYVEWMVLNQVSYYHLWMLYAQVMAGFIR